jgi:hypothetical protein
MELFTDLILPAALWVDSASKRSESQEYLLGRKGDRYLGLKTLPLLRTDCLDFWEPQHPGTLRACPGTASLALQRTLCRASMFSVMGVRLHVSLFTETADYS